MKQHELFLAGLVCLGVGLGIAVAWLTTRRAKGFRKRLLDELVGLDRQGDGIEKRLIEIVGNRERWKRSLSLIRKPFSNHVNLAVETAAMIYALVGLVNALVRFDKSFASPAQASGIVIFLSMVVGYLPAERLISSAAGKEMDAVVDGMEEALATKRAAAFLERAQKEWR